MKVYMYFLLGILFFSCKNEKSKIVNKKAWTNQEIINYYKDSIANRKYTEDELDQFSENYKAGYIIKEFIKKYSDSIKAVNNKNVFNLAFDEPYIDTTNLDKNKNFIRLIVAPSNRAYCITLEKIMNNSILTLKFSNDFGPLGNYGIGQNNFVNKEFYNNTMYDNFINDLKSIDYQNIGFDTINKCKGCCIGDFWNIEIINNGNFKHFLFHSPLTVKSNEITKKLVSMFLKLRYKAKFREFLKLKFPNEKFNEND